MNKRPITFDQTDPRWAKNSYSTHNDRWQTMAGSGSAPTLCADVVATMKGRDVDPWVLAKQALEWGDRTYASGTSYCYFGNVAKYYGFAKFVRSDRFSALLECLDAGGLVVCAMSKGLWCRGGNYILAWRYDNEYVYAVTAEKRQPERQKIEGFKRESRCFFCFYPD